MREVGTEVSRQRALLKVIQDVMAGFTIRAPAPGMLIYVKEQWSGKKRTTGSQVRGGDPAGGTLPDLAKMESVTYVNEIDVRKVAVGQPVVITLDADPAKKLTGRVTNVANVGEQRPNSDAKVFEVKIQVEQSDSTLRPGMTTGNVIETLKLDTALYVPLEALRHNKLRASLTSLGILFGVASVIAMLAIGKGAEQEILAQLRLLGSNNVVITPLVEQKEGPVEATPTKEVKKFSPGLTYADAQAIARVIPAVDVTSAEIVLNTTITREGRHRSGKVVGVDTTYFRLTSLELAAGGWVTPLPVELGPPGAIIGDGVRARFFTTEAPLGRSLKVGNIWLTVVGGLAD